MWLESVLQVCLLCNYFHCQRRETTILHQICFINFLFFFFVSRNVRTGLILKYSSPINNQIKTVSFLLWNIMCETGYALDLEITNLMATLQLLNMEHDESVMQQIIMQKCFSTAWSEFQHTEPRPLHKGPLIWANIRWWMIDDQLQPH